ncbi:MAG TPA: hypothetical protein VFV05_06665 [Methylomirabilota bacterium]|nr:hypothetical protein [Methylomirabilota bacterium]
MKNRLLAIFLVALGGVALGGCVYRERTVPAASPPTTVVVAPSARERVVTYPEGRYELRGDGTASAPYYWVWIPAGAAPPNPPPLPRRPRTQ